MGLRLPVRSAFSVPVRNVAMLRGEFGFKTLAAIAVTWGALLLCCSTAAAWFADPADERPPSDDPQIQKALERGIAYLGGSGERAQSESLVALALLKSGKPVDDPRVARSIEQLLARTADGTYKATGSHYYIAGLDMMLLETADPETYRKEMEAILKYIVDGQLENGSWYYPGQGGKGDTSITQYAMLGLWSAERGGLEVPSAVWDKAAAWHVRTQAAKGGFDYHPLDGGGGGMKRTMTAAAVGSLCISRMYLYPNRELALAQEKRQFAVEKKYRFLEPVALDDPLSTRKKETKVRRTDYKPTTTLSAIDAAIEKGIDWLGSDWSITNDGASTLYYLYALERMAALANIDLIGEHDWYAEASKFLVVRQNSDGSWNTTYSRDVDTPFAVLCLGKATARMLDRAPRSFGVGAGLLAGGRGLPENLAQVQVTDGKVQARKLSGPLDELLNELENPKSTKVESVQTALLEKIQLGDREELIGQTDRLLKLAEDPRVEVRRTALWALGHSGDVRFAPVMISAFDDPDLDVLVEARNALCTLSRKPRGLGLPDNPYAGLPDGAGNDDRSQALVRWRTELTKRWKEWYRLVEPYDERDGLPEVSRK